MNKQTKQLIAKLKTERRSDLTSFIKEIMDGDVSLSRDELFNIVLEMG